MNTVTIKVETFPNVVLVVGKHKKMRKTHLAIRKGKETKDNHYAFYNEAVQLHTIFCTICGNYMMWSHPNELDERIICCDLEHYKLQNTKFYKKEMKQTMKKIEKCEAKDKKTLTKELQNISVLASDWINNI